MERRITEIIEKICGIHASDITLDMDLFEEGFLDSFGTLELLVTLSEEFDVDLDVSEIERAQVASVEKITETICKKKG